MKYFQNVANQIEERNRAIEAQNKKENIERYLSIMVQEIQTHLNNNTKPPTIELLCHQVIYHYQQKKGFVTQDDLINAWNAWISPIKNKLIREQQFQELSTYEKISVNAVQYGGRTLELTKKLFEQKIEEAKNKFLKAQEELTQAQKNRQDLSDFEFANQFISKVNEINSNLMT